MGKEKFIYNTHTLQYEKIEVTTQEKVLKLFGFISVAIVTSLLLLSVFYKVFPSPREKVLLSEIDQLKLNYARLDKSLDLMGKAVANVQERDSGLYRQMFMMEPLSKVEGGTGGHDKFLNLAKFASADVIVNTESKIEQISRDIILQSKSLDTLQRLAKEKEKMFASLPSIKPVREDQLNKDVSQLSGFGMRFHPIHHTMKLHKGIDFSSPQGTPIQATGDGEVIKAGSNSGYGNCVIINHSYGYETLYGHMYKITVTAGQKVKKGQQIGIVGSTGSSTGPHCHYEVHLNGKEINPLQFCLDGLTTAEYQTLVTAAKTTNKSFD